MIANLIYIISIIVAILCGDLAFRLLRYGIKAIVIFEGIKEKNVVWMLMVIRIFMCLFSGLLMGYSIQTGF
jgi:hypothetical protein